MSSVLNENHKRHLQSSFRYMDKLLSEAEHAMTDAGSPSPFREHADDTTPIQRKVTHDYIVRIREAMRRVMEELEVPPVEPRRGATWAAAISFMFCAIALSDLTADKMRAYGNISEEGATAVESIRSEIGALLNKLNAYLAKGGGGDFRKRVWSGSAEPATKSGCWPKSNASLPRMASWNFAAHSPCCSIVLNLPLSRRAFRAGQFRQVVVAQLHSPDRHAAGWRYARHCDPDAYQSRTSRGGRYRICRSAGEDHPAF